jgi:hypothetical protein
MPVGCGSGVVFTAVVGAVGGVRGRDDAAGLELAAGQQCDDVAGALEPVAGHDAVVDRAAVALGQVCGVEVGPLDDVVERQAEHVAADALEDRDLVAVDADVVLLHDPQPSKTARCGEYQNYHGDPR